MQTKSYLINYVLIFFFLVITPFNTKAFEHFITFTGSGESISIDSVIVQNLSQGTQITVPAGNQLRLYDVETSIDGLNPIADFASLYPNPMIENSTFSFVAKKSGNTQITVYSIDGKKIEGLELDLQQGYNSFLLSLPKGVFLVQAKGNGFSYFRKVISLTITVSKPNIKYIGNQNSLKLRKVSSPVVKMQYTPGNQILYKGYSGNYCTIVTDKPTESKTTDFKFVDCTDADGNHYAVVHIGSQTWMAENLKTTNYIDGTPIPEVTDSSTWRRLTSGAYCYYNNNEMYKNKYGCLYNWYAANTVKLAPQGWHVATNPDWVILENYLIANGYNYDGTLNGNKIAKALSSTTDWLTHPIEGNIGYDLTKNNRSGFSALPNGFRNNGGFYNARITSTWWSSTEFNNDSSLYKQLYNNLNKLGTDIHNKDDGFSIRCIKNTCPTLTTSPVTSIGQLTATSGGNITSDGGAEVTARGVCWSTSQNPTIADSKTSDGTGTGTFTSSITGLTANTSYYVRAYATNSEGTCYGEEVIFKTKDYTVENCGTVTDIDGNVYQTVNIGGKCWMAENLKTTKYRNGDAIPNVTASSEWVALTTGAWCVYNNNASYASTYGLLYNWYAVGDTRGLAPEGWHVASTEEWQTMANYLIANGYNYDGSTSGNKIGKAVGTTENWISSSYPGGVGNNQSSNNKSGLSIPPGGGRQHATGDYFVMNYHSNLYTSTEVNATHARMIGLYFDADYLMLGLEGDGAPKYLGASVRCVKD